MILTASQFFLYLLFIPVLSSAADTIDVNRSLSGNQILVSLDGNFEMGFFKPGKAPNYYIGIWYNKAKVTIETVVWVANRNTPIHDTFSSELKIIDGNLVLLNESNTQIWSTYMNSTATPASVVLLDDGNLVIRYGSNSSTQIWQSFDHPTHTFLPGGKLGNNKRTNTNQILTSWRSIEDPGMGLFSLELDQNERRYLIKRDRSVDYWTSGSWSPYYLFRFAPEMRLDHIYDFSYVDNENESYFTYSLYNPSIISRFIIDVSGQTRQLSWLDNTGKWNLFLSQLCNVYKVYGGCGAFGVCNHHMFPPCDCLTGFKPRSQSDWNLGCFFSGCVRKTELHCSVTKEKPMFIISYVEKSYLSAFSENEPLQLDEAACRSSCSDYCLCFAYTFIYNICQHWNQKNLNNISYILSSNGSYPDTIYIKVAFKDNKEVMGAVLGSVEGVVLVLGVIFLILYRKKMICVGKTTMEGSLVAFVYRDLQTATKKFLK